jgi:multiple sugar transport system ATP-binding protein
LSLREQRGPSEGSNRSESERVAVDRHVVGARLEGITKIFGEEMAVDDLSLEIHPGELLVLVGPSGCGKTTTLRMLAGLERPTYGSIFINEKEVNRLSPSARNVAMVFQSYALYPHMTVRKNLVFALRAKRERAGVIRERLADVSAMLGLEALLQRKPSELSGGQRQRVALGRALMRHPDIFLLDEPLSNLDAALRTQMRGDLVTLHREIGVTTVYVTHDQVEAMTMADRIGVIMGGRLLQVDIPEVVYSRPVNVSVASFIGSPKINLLEGTAWRDGSKCLVRWDDVTFSLDDAGLFSGENRAVTVGIRAEDLSWIQGETSESGSTVVGTVRLVEPLGSETLVTLDRGAKALVARFPPHCGVRPGDKVAVAAEGRHVHLFDRETGERLGR